MAQKASILPTFGVQVYAMSGPSRAPCCQEPKEQMVAADPQPSCRGRTGLGRSLRAIGRALHAIGPTSGLLLRSLIQVTIFWTYSKYYGFWIIVTSSKFLKSKPDIGAPQHAQKTSTPCEDIRDTTKRRSHVAIPAVSPTEFPSFLPRMYQEQGPRTQRRSGQQG